MVFEIAVLCLWLTVSVCVTANLFLPPLAERVHVSSPRRGLGLLRLTFDLFNYFTFLYTQTPHQAGLMTLYMHVFSFDH